MKIIFEKAYNISKVKYLNLNFDYKHVFVLNFK